MSRKCLKNTKAFAADCLCDASFMPHYVGNVYIRLLLKMVQSQKPIVNDIDSIIAFTGCDEAQDAINYLAKHKYFSINENNEIWTEKALLDSPDKIAEKSEKAKRAALARWNKTQAKQQNSTSVQIVQTKESKGCRLPSNFQPKMETHRNLGVPDDTAVEEFEKFKDYWNAKTGKDATKLDWDATWRNWLRNTKERKYNGSYSAAKCVGQKLSDATKELKQKGGVDAFWSKLRNG